MSVITKELLQGLDTNIKVTWQKRYNEAPGADLWKTIAMPVNSTGASEKYSWLGSVPGLREFKSERIPGTLSGYSYEIDNKKWESTLDVDRDVLEDDRTGQIMIAVNSMATKAGKHYTKLVTAAFDAAYSTVIWNGQNFFDADHDSGSNYLGTAALTGENLDAAELLLTGQKDDRGELLGYQGTHLIVGPALRATAERLVKAQLINDGGVAVDNPYAGRYTVVVLPQLGMTSKKWAVADLSEGLLPFVLQIRVAIGAPVAKTDLNSDRAFDKDIFTWGIRARHNAGLGNHQLIVGAIAP